MRCRVTNHGVVVRNLLPVEYRKTVEVKLCAFAREVAPVIGARLAVLEREIIDEETRVTLLDGVDIMDTGDEREGLFEQVKLDPAPFAHIQLCYRVLERLYMGIEAVDAGEELRLGVFFRNQKDAREGDAAALPPDRDAVQEVYRSREMRAAPKVDDEGVAKKERIELRERVSLKGRYLREVRTKHLRVELRKSMYRADEIALLRGAGVTDVVNQSARHKRLYCISLETEETGFAGKAAHVRAVAAVDIAGDVREGGVYVEPPVVLGLGMGQGPFPKQSGGLFARLSERREIPIAISDGTVVEVEERLGNRLFHHRSVLRFFFAQPVVTLLVKFEGELRSAVFDDTSIEEDMHVVRLNEIQ